MRLDMERRERRKIGSREIPELERLRIQRSPPPSVAHTGINLRKFRDALQFREDKVDKYFPSFERCVSELQWPEEL